MIYAGIRTYLFIVFAFFTLEVIGQNANNESNLMDTLQQMLVTEQNDSIRCQILDKMIEQEQDDQKWPAYNEQMRKIAESNLRKSQNNKTNQRFFLEIEGKALNNSGYAAQVNGEMNKALFYFNKCYLIQEKINDKEGMAATLNNLGTVQNAIGDIPKALDYYHRSLKIQEELKEFNGVAYSLNNIGYIFKSVGNFSKALEYYKRSLEIRIKIKDKEGIAISTNNIGSLFRDTHEFEKAQEYYEKSLSIYESLGDRSGASVCLHNIGNNYKEQNKHKEALIYFNKSLSLAEETGNQRGLSNTLISIANIYFEEGKLKEAESFGWKSMEISKKLGYPENIRNAGNLLSQVCASLGNYKKAYEMHVIFKRMADSINNLSNRRVALQKDLQYNYDKKAAQDSIKSSEERKIAKANLDASRAQLKEERTLKFALYGGFAMVIIFSGFLYNRFRITMKQKLIIEKKELETQRQKQVIEEKQKEVMDSIYYAQRIQKAQLPTEKMIHRTINKLNRNK